MRVVNVTTTTVEQKERENERYSFGSEDRYMGIKCGIGKHIHNQCRRERKKMKKCSTQ